MQCVVAGSGGGGEGSRGGTLEERPAGGALEGGRAAAQWVGGRAAAGTESRWQEGSAGRIRGVFFFWGWPRLIGLRVTK